MHEFLTDGWWEDVGHKFMMGAYFGVQALENFTPSSKSDDWAYGAGGAALGQFIASSGLYSGQDIYGQQMSRTDIAMAGIGVIPGGGNAKYSVATYKAFSLSSVCILTDRNLA